ncbi:PHD finger protein 24-like [Actinia tenebrosa]|uniref:PHD finger protein 24-like n=1 Tax=Actinia tenebrosa TaxID=6105 RepID=A0A6P8HWT7_ACTTE|nr:PHD finger protein 24-like [Actinia tenebrosa]
MGVVVSKKTGQEKTKKVQQTAAVVKAFKTNPSPKPCPKLFGAQNSRIAPLQGDSKYSNQAVNLGNYSLSGRNPDKESFSYGLPELEDTNAGSRLAGTTGFWSSTEDSTSTVPYFGAWSKRVENDELCFECGVYTAEPVLPCKICCKVFHETCMKKRGRLNDPWELKMFRDANSKTGWSCHKCESLTSLLTEEEMQELIESFDRLDVNQDTQITQVEYIRYKKAKYKDIHKVEMPKVQVDEAAREFTMIDKNSTGTIDWWEFLNHESLKTLGIKRSQFQLVKMLSPREIQEVRDIFHAFDTDEDGYINSYEVSKGFGRWFGNLRISDGPGQSSSSFGRPLDAKTVSGHVDRHTEIFMHADTNNNRLVSWDEYLREKALYVLAERPNYRTDDTEKDIKKSTKKTRSKRV